MAPFDYSIRRRVKALEDAGGSVVDVLGAGVSGDGTPDAAAVNAVLAALPGDGYLKGSGCALYFPATATGYVFEDVIPTASCSIIAEQGTFFRWDATARTAGIIVSNLANLSGFRIYDGNFTDAAIVLDMQSSGSDPLFIDRVFVARLLGGSALHLAQGGYDIFISDCSFQSAAGRVNILEDGSNETLSLSNVVLGPSGAAGLELKTTQNVSIDGLNTNNFTGNPSDPVILIDPGSGDTVGSVTIANLVAAGMIGLKVAPTGTGKVDDVDVSSGHLFGGDNGIVTTGNGTIRNLKVGAGVSILRNNHHGIQHGNGAGLSVTGATIQANGKSASNTYDGINIAANLNDFTITGCRAGGGSKGVAEGQRYGINVVAGTSDSYLVKANNLRGNVTDGLNDGGTGIHKDVSGNLS